MAIKRKGADVHGGITIPMSALKNAGVEFLLIRCGYGGDYTSQDDSGFFRWINACKAAGMPYGVWLYSYALTVEQAKSEAAHALRLLKQVDKPAYGVWFDMEDADQYKRDHGMPSNDTLVRICDTFCREIEAAGYYCGIYAGLSWLENQLKDSRLDRYDKWVAQWNATCDYKGDYGIWQYAGDNGPNRTVIAGEVVDMDFAYRDYPVLTGAEKKDTKPEEKNEVKKEVRYNSIAEMPDWAKPTITKLVDKKMLNGGGGKKDAESRPADLDLSLDMIRLLVINDRAGLYDLPPQM